VGFTIPGLLENIAGITRVPNLLPPDFGWAIVKEKWDEEQLFRFGASSLLGDIERQLEHHVTGRYSAAHRHPMA